MVDGHSMFFNSLQSSAYDNVYVISKTVCYNYHEAVLLSHFQRGMNDIVAGVQQYQSSLVSNLRSQIEQVLKKHSENTCSTSVATTFRQNSVMKKQLSIVDAEEIPISQTVCKRRHGASKDVFIKDKVFHYIPLVKSLEQFLSHPKIFGFDD